MFGKRSFAGYFRSNVVNAAMQFSFVEFTDLSSHCIFNLTDKKRSCKQWRSKGRAIESAAQSQALAAHQDILFSQLKTHL